MNNNVELLIRLIIPALFLLAWALNQVLNKDVRPAPPQRGPLPDPFRNRLPPAQRPAGGTFVERLERTAPPPPRPSPTLRSGEEIVIVETESRSLRPPSASTPTPSRAGRRNRNPKRPPSGGSSPKPSNTQNRNRPSGMGNLATGLTDSPINVPVTPVAGINPASLGSASLDTRGPALNPTIVALQGAVASPERVRQAILLNEILQPPIALRGRRLRPRSGG